MRFNNVCHFPFVKKSFTTVSKLEAEAIVLPSLSFILDVATIFRYPRYRHRCPRHRRPFAGKYCSRLCVNFDCSRSCVNLELLFFALVFIVSFLPYTCKCIVSIFIVPVHVSFCSCSSSYCFIASVYVPFCSLCFDCPVDVSICCCSCLYCFIFPVYVSIYSLYFDCSRSRVNL